jgi:hypothetical protein
MAMANITTEGRHDKPPIVQNGDHTSDDEKAKPERDKYSKAEKGLDAAEERASRSHGHSSGS